MPVGALQSLNISAFVSERIYIREAITLPFNPDRVTKQIQPTRKRAANLRVQDGAEEGSLCRKVTLRRQHLNASLR